MVGLSWSLDVPGMVQLLRLPGLNLMSHNRFVFVTAFAILILAAAGLNALWQGNIPARAGGSWRGWAARVDCRLVPPSHLAFLPEPTAMIFVFIIPRLRRRFHRQ